jgi:hypothetical protein
MPVEDLAGVPGAGEEALPGVLFENMLGEDVLCEDVPGEDSPGEDVPP